MDIKKIFQSKIFLIFTCLTAALIVFLLIFQAGMIIGHRKASFSCRWEENYMKNFGGPFGKLKGHFLPGPGDRGFIRAGGVSGQIIKIEGQAITVKDRDGIEKIVIVNDKTEIKKFRDAIKLQDLKTDDLIVVIGEPNSGGQIEARLIRVMPSKQLDEMFQNLGAPVQDDVEIKGTSTESGPDKK